MADMPHDMPYCIKFNSHTCLYSQKCMLGTCNTSLHNIMSKACRTMYFVPKKSKCRAILFCRQPSELLKFDWSSICSTVQHVTLGTANACLQLNWSYLEVAYCSYKAFQVKTSCQNANLAPCACSHVLSGIRRGYSNKGGVHTSHCNHLFLQPVVAWCHSRLCIVATFLAVPLPASISLNNSDKLKLVGFS